MRRDGWIAIHRKIQDHWLYPKNRPFTKYEAFIDILLEVNHEEGSWNSGELVLICNRGESLYSFDTWAKRWRWTKSKARRFLIFLEREKIIKLKNELKTTRLIVCNYEHYQPKRTADEPHLERKRNADEPHLKPKRNLYNKKEEEKKEKKEKHIPSASLRGSAEVEIDSLLGSHAERFRELDVVIRACDRVSQMPSQLTPAEYLKLLEEFDSDQVHDIILIMDNWKKLNKNNVSVYFTAQTWLKRNFGGGDIQELIPLFEEEYRAFCKRESIGAKIDANERRALRGLITYLIENNVQSTKEGALSAWKYILAPKNWSKLDRFTRKRIKLQDIESDIIKIMAQLKEANKPGSDRFPNYWDRRLEKRLMDEDMKSVQLYWKHLRENCNLRPQKDSRGNTIEWIEKGDRDK